MTGPKAAKTPSDSALAVNSFSGGFEYIVTKKSKESNILQGQREAF